MLLLFSTCSSCADRDLRLSPMLRLETLSLVSSKLADVEDLVHCAAVSKLWAAAVTVLQPRLLCIDHKGTGDEEDHIAYTQLRLLQGWQRQGRLQNLKGVSLKDNQGVCFEVDEDVDDGERELNFADPSPLSQGLITLAGSWNLSSCELTGPFSVKAAVDMLPPNLIRLRLWPDSGPDEFNLSAFKRFTKLTWLWLAFGRNIEENDPDCELVLDMAMPFLQHIIVTDRLRCISALDMTAEELFPDVDLLSLKIMADAKGKSLAEGVVALPKLRTLCLKIYDGEGSEWKLVIPKTSSIEQLEVTGAPNQPRLTLELQKAIINYKCIQLHSVFSLPAFDYEYFGVGLFAGIRA